MSGVQPEIGLPLIDGKFVEGLTVDELYGTCSDLVAQLATYCCRRLAERPEKSLRSLLARVRHRVKSKGWELSDAGAALDHAAQNLPLIRPNVCEGRKCESPEETLTVRKT